MLDETKAGSECNDGLGTYYLYEETVDDESGQAMERLHGMLALTFNEAKELLARHPRYQGIDFYDGTLWHFDVEA